MFFLTNHVLQYYHFPRFQFGWQVEIKCKIRLQNYLAINFLINISPKCMTKRWTMWPINHQRYNPEIWIWWVFAFNQRLEKRLNIFWEKKIWALISKSWECVSGHVWEPELIPSTKIKFDNMFDIHAQEFLGCFRVSGVKQRIGFLFSSWCHWNGGCPVIKTVDRRTIKARVGTASWFGKWNEAAVFALLLVVCLQVWSFIELVAQRWVHLGIRVGAREGDSDSIRRYSNLYPKTGAKDLLCNLSGIQKSWEEGSMSCPCQK